MDKNTKSKVEIVNGGATVLRSNDSPSKIKDAGTQMPYLEISSDTVTIKEGEVYYLEMFLKSCKGAMYLERHPISNDKIVFSDNYIDAVKLDTVQAWTADPMTGNRTLRAATNYRPLRTGGWVYYGEKGELLKEEEYENGALIGTGKDK